MRPGLLVMAGLLPVVGLWASLSQAAEDHRLTLESGEVSGMYYPEAGAICRVVNKDRSRHGVHCLVDPTAGSAANLQALKNGDGDLAIVQSGVLIAAQTGSGPFAKAPIPDLRALLSLHGESVAVVSGPDTKARDVKDLKGKRVALGHPGSFQRLMADALLAAEGLSVADFSQVQDLDMARVAQSLCHNETDAVVVTGLHPIAEVQDAMDDCGAQILSLKGQDLESYLKANPAFVHQVIGQDAYGGGHGKIATFGVSAVLVGTTRLSPADGYEVVKAVFESLTPLKAMYPRFSDLERKQMAHDALVVPLHDGALQYYKEAGLR